MNEPVDILIENNIINEIIELDSTMKIRAYDTFLTETKKITTECLDIDRNISIINQQLLKIKLRRTQVADKHKVLL